MSTKQTTSILVSAIVILLLAITFLSLRMLRTDRFPQEDEPITTIQDDEGDIEEEDGFNDEDYLSVAFVEFHLEVASYPIIRKTWPDLRAAVKLADEYGFKYSLMFTPQWAEVVLSDDDLLEELHTWEANGHEIGVHHHLSDHRFWDGYSNDPADSALEGYNGTMDDLMEIVSQLPEDGVIYSGAISEAGDDYPDNLPFNTVNTSKESGGDPSIEGMVSAPEAREYDGQIVLELGKMGYAIDHLEENITVADVEEQILESLSDEVLGVVLNDDTIKNQFDEIEPLFQLLIEYEIEVRSVGEILSTYEFSTIK